ncbi:MAG: FAD-dependent oxidoreductase [candidate division NC10 bacterium]|nr:FAD-dependent oxidoreductase [candidate division NC10 bacterium]
MTQRRIVIVGNSAASLAALEAIRRLDGTSPVTLVSDEAIPAYSRVLLPYLVSGERRDLSLRPPDFSQRMGARMLLGRRAVQIDADALGLDDGTRLPFDRLLLATGSRAAIPDIEGIDTPGVFALKTMADALRIREQLPGARHAVILGGGLICLLVVHALLKVGLSVTIAVSSDRLLTRMLDEAAAALLQHRLEGAGVRILTRTDAARIVGHEGRIRSVVTAAGEALPADLVILAKGIRPDIDLARAGGVATGRGVLVDEYLRTSRPGVFAAGDCAEGPDMLVPGKKSIPGTWFEAVAQGECAGANMLDPSRPSPGAFKMNVMEILGIAVASMGLIQAPDAEGRVVVRARDGNYRKLVISRDRIVGAVLVGDVSEAGTIAMLIRRGLTLSELRPFDPSRPIRYADLAVQWGSRARDSAGCRPHWS